MRVLAIGMLMLLGGCTIYITQDCQGSCTATMAPMTSTTATAPVGPGL